MIRPALSGDAFLNDVEQARTEKDSFHLWWLGQSGFLILWQDAHLLLDPYLSDSLTRKYAGTDKPHIRMTEGVIAPERLDFIDIATSSHNHTDHLDADTLIPLLRVNPKLTLIIPEANRSFVAERLKIDPQRPIGLDDGVSTEVNGFRFTGIPAAHETLERDERGRHHFLGYVISFGPWTLYHSGDTIWYEGLEERLRTFSLDLAILPINGRAPERRVAGNLDGREAAQLARAAGARLVIPCHYEMFTFNTASPDVFVEECRRLGLPFQLLKAGERWTSRSLNS